MHLSNHAFISAFLRQYFFVDTNSRQCFKNIHAKKEKKNQHCCFLPFTGLPGILKKAHFFHFFVCWFDCSPTHVLCVPHEACVSKPFYLLRYLCTKLGECKATFPAAAREHVKIKLFIFCKVGLLFLRGEKKLTFKYLFISCGWISMIAFSKAQLY